ncbi:hypothetical protein [Salinispora tropica]|uniref:Uncharacterized protein n=1 Tax=Salinispora tropica (strain ATCC BAA-916 / DSM 44818 / JCM 13857 / NBRC 105044 / CNB-440) TaxID=369723 RepID=A4X299_SALTO|nr:hypothetical protein [Salinispora tropica]ABP52999.1 hypothetical protein Strop_0515 [Salinispora tropica CNB-440]
MNITPRREEIAEVVAILESGAYDGPDAMAADLIRAVAGLLWFRTWWVLGARGPRAANFGPFASEAEAVRWGKQVANMAIPAEWGVVQVHGMGRIATNAKGGREGGGFGYCVTAGCGCPPYAHAMDKSTRGKCVICGSCDRYQQSERKPAKRAKREPA